MFELDHSQAHKRFTEYFQIAKNLNLNPGGAIPAARYMHVAKDSLSPFHYNDKFKVGDACYHEFTWNYSPPKGNENMPKYDIIDKPGVQIISAIQWKEE